MGLPDLQVEDITVSGVTLRAAGGGTDADAAGSLPHFTEERLAGWWPEYHRFERTVPASGLYAANVDGLRLSELDFTTAAADARPPVVARDCRVVSASGSAGT
jgi:hypothetical protein